MKNWIFVLCLTWLANAATVFSAQPPASLERMEAGVLALSDVPSDIMAVAKSALPDAYFKTADWVFSDDARVYRISGGFYRQEVAVHVREDGKLLRVERDNRDD